MDDSINSDSAESGMSETNDTSFESDTKSMCLETLKIRLEDCLGSLQSAGTFAFFEHLPNPVNPGLYVKGLGSVGLPLSDRDAKAIKEAFGKQPDGEPFELSPRYFEARNPAWQQFIDSLIPKITLSLGIEVEGGTVGIELKAMRLYDQNSKLELFQNDPKKASGTFGDLAICLPSKHESGEIRISHLGKSKVYETAQYSEYDSSLIAWYSDVILEKEHVKSGYQLVLFYRLRYIGRAAGSASKAIEGNAKLCGLLASWKTNFERNQEPEVLAYILEHKVTAALCHNALGGRDQEVVQHLKEACSVSGYYLYLASLERSVEGSTEEYDDYDDWRCDDEEHRSILEVHSTAVQLTKVADLDGVVVGQNINIKDDEIIQDNMFERDPDEEDHDQGSAIHYYRETAAIIVPRDARVQFFLGMTRSLTSSCEKRNEYMKNWLTDLSNDLETELSNRQAAEDLLCACRILTNAMNHCFAKRKPLHSNELPYSAEIVEIVCKISLRLVETPFPDLGRNLFLEILKFDFSLIPQPSKTSQSIFPTIGRGIAVFGLQSLESILSVSMSHVFSFSCRCRILEALGAGYRLAKWGLPLPDELDLPNAESGFANSFGIEDPELSTWLNQCYKEALTQCEISLDEDVTYLIKMAAAFGPEFLLHDITHAVKQHASCAGLVMIFMIELLKSSNESKIPRETALKAFRDVLPDMVKYFSLGSIEHAGSKRQKTGFGMYYAMNHDRRISEMVEKLNKDSQNMADILCKCVALGLTSEADQIISKVLAETHNIPAEHYDVVVLGFLKRVLVHLSDQEADLTNPRFQLLFQHSLAIYVDRFVRPEPTRPTNWTRTARGCGCLQCKDLEKFLRNPNEQEFRCNNGLQPRRHLETILSSQYPGDYIFETDKRRSPHTLIITKTTRNGEFTRDHADWEKRGETAVARMKELGVESLKKVMGDQFDATMGLKWVRLGAHISDHQRLIHTIQTSADDIEVITID